jgi:hypothetical protein
MMRLPDPVVIVRGPVKDAFGDLPADGVAERFCTRGAYADAGTSEDVTSRGATVSTTSTLYLPFGTDVVRTDRIEVRGRVWEIDGDPQHWRSPLTGTPATTVVNLRSVRG